MNYRLAPRERRTCPSSSTSCPRTGSTGPDRADMPLTEQQLYGIASDARWADTMSAAFIGSAHSIQLAAEPY